MEFKFLPGKPVLQPGTLPKPCSRTLARVLASSLDSGKGGVKNLDNPMLGAEFRDSFPFPSYQNTPPFPCVTAGGCSGSCPVNNERNQPRLRMVCGVNRGFSPFSAHPQGLSVATGPRAGELAGGWSPSWARQRKEGSPIHSHTSTFVSNRQKHYPGGPGFWLAR